MTTQTTTDTPAPSSDSRIDAAVAKWAAEHLPDAITEAFEDGELCERVAEHFDVASLAEDAVGRAVEECDGLDDAVRDAQQSRDDAGESAEAAEASAVNAADSAEEAAASAVDAAASARRASKAWRCMKRYERLRRRRSFRARVLRTLGW